MTSRISRYRRFRPAAVERAAGALNVTRLTPELRTLLLLAPAASGAVALNAKSESTGVNDPAVLLTWTAKLADPSEERTPLVQVTSRKPEIPVITITGGTGKLFHVPAGHDTVYWPTAVLLEGLTP